MRSNDPRRRLFNFICQLKREEIDRERWQAYRAVQPGLAKADRLIQQILDDLETSRLQADADSQEKEEKRQKKILRHQRIRHYAYKHVNDYMHARAKELWGKYLENEDFRNRINDYAYNQVKELWGKYHEGENFEDFIEESIERILAALGRACEGLKGTEVSETTGSPIADHPVNASWNSQGKYRFYRGDGSPLHTEAA
jgi:hypothetical protein